MVRNKYQEFESTIIHRVVRLASSCYMTDERGGSTVSIHHQVVLGRERAVRRAGTCFDISLPVARTERVNEPTSTEPKIGPIVFAIAPTGDFCFITSVPCFDNLQCGFHGIAPSQRRIQRLPIRCVSDATRDVQVAFHASGILRTQANVLR